MIKITGTFTLFLPDTMVNSLIKSANGAASSSSRSDAAKRAWITRRKTLHPAEPDHGAKLKRKRAAKKAWKTRRARAAQ